MLKKLDRYAYIFQKWQRIEETLLKLNICIFLRKDDELLKKYNKIWKNTADKEFDRDPVYKEKNLKAKMQSYNGKINTIIKYQNKVFNVFAYQ